MIKWHLIKNMILVCVYLRFKQSLNRIGRKQAVLFLNTVQTQQVPRSQPKIWQKIQQNWRSPDSKDSNFQNVWQCLAQALSSVCYKLHHCTQIYLFHQECDAFQKKNTCLNQKLDIQYSSFLLFKPHRFFGICQNALFLRISQNALSFRNVLGRTILQECPRTHYYFDEIYEAHESSFVCIKPLNK